MTLFWPIAAVFAIAFIVAAAVLISALLRQKGTPEYPPPAWSEFLSRAEYEVFQSYVDRAAKAENQVTYFRNGMLLICASATVEVQIPLQSLLQPCLDRPMSEWAGMLRTCEVIAGPSSVSWQPPAQPSDGPSRRHDPGGASEMRPAE